jgi:hypothetical protein
MLNDLFRFSGYYIINVHVMYLFIDESHIKGSEVKLYRTTGFCDHQLF